MGGIKLPLSELMRPRQLGDLTLPRRDIARLQKMVETGNLMNMIFYGAPGNGKTSAARVLIKAIGAEKSHYEVNGSSLTGIDHVRSRIEPYATSLSLFPGPKICFVDEADYQTKNAQSGLRHLIEKTYKNCRFLFTANDLPKLIPAIQSRMMSVCFDISYLDWKEVVEQLRARYEAQLEELGWAYDQKTLTEIIGAFFPDLREIANRVEYEFDIGGAAEAP